jgi:histone acetyltransferase HTATIP
LDSSSLAWASIHDQMPLYTHRFIVSIIVTEQHTSRQFLDVMAAIHTEVEVRYGKFLIEFSYELSKREGRVGSPEKPLSDLGLLSYRSYWTEQIVQLLLEARQSPSPTLSIESMSSATAIAKEDILHTLQAIDALKYRRGQYLLVLSPKVISDYEAGVKKTRIQFDPRSLHWTLPKFTAAQLRFL